MFAFQFDEKTINYILNLLGEKPYKDVAPIIQTIQQQAASQIQKNEAEQEVSDLPPQPPKSKK